MLLEAGLWTRGAKLNILPITATESHSGWLAGDVVANKRLPALKQMRCWVMVE